MTKRSGGADLGSAVRCDGVLESGGSSIDLTSLNRVALQYGLSALTNLPVPWSGATSQVFPLHDVVLKVPFAAPDAIRSLKVDTAVSVLMRHRGVQTPELLAFDESLDILPVPFTLYRRVPDSTTLQVAGGRRDVTDAWREAGRQLAIVHAVTNERETPVSLRSFRQTPELDPCPWVDDLRTSGVLGAADAAWLRALLNELAPIVSASEPVTLCHGDVNAANVLVHEKSGGFLALIDWAGAGWLDPAWDFAGVPLDAVPHLLAGHRAVTPMPDDEMAEARIFWCQAQTRLHAALGAANRGETASTLERDVRHLRHFAAEALS